MTTPRKIIIEHFAIIILIFIIGSYLIIKAIPENSWDFWRVGSAQTLLSNQHWVNDGLLKNYFLFLPQGYSKTVRYFDEPELRQHARGITTGALIGKRLYYTHYPSGYLLPTALLMKLGVEERVWLRFLEILFSLGALAILYWIFLMISSRPVAIFGVIYYGASILFLDYADTLANQPMDELLRFTIVALSIATLNYKKKYLNYIIWIFYFILSLSSYDSTFFIFAWLVCLDILFNKKINWKLWIFWASAPVFTFAIQLLQNTLYLGWQNMFLDLYGAFKVQMVGSRGDFFVSHLKRLIDPFGWFFEVKWYMGILISVSGIVIIKFIKKYWPPMVSKVEPNEIPDLRFLYLGFAAVFFHFLFFPSLFFYQGRILSLFGAFLVGILTTYLFKIVRKNDFIPKLTSTSIQQCIVVLGIFVLVSVLWFIQGKRTYEYIKKWPNNVWPAESINFDKKIKNLVSGDKVIFQILGPEREIPGSDRYPMAASEDEYYIGSPILGFTNTNDLIRDFNYLKKRSEFSFNAIIIANQNETIEKVRKKLQIKELASQINNRFILIIPE